jgi:putative hydrolase of the HAD superfamily
MADISWVLLDLGQTVVRFDWRRALAALHKLGARAHLNVAEFADDPLFHDFESGRITPEPFFIELGRRIGCPAPWTVLEEAYSDIFIPWPERENLMPRLAPHYRLAAASNTCISHINWLAPRSTVLNHFHERFYSYELGERKPNARFYEMILEKLGASADNCLFVDDRHDNIQGAGAVGIRVLHVSPEEDLGERLKQVGVRLSD